MTNDTTTLNGALTELGETMADNLVSMGVVDADAGDGLTTLAGKILTIEPSIGGLDLDTAITLTSSSASITLGGSVVLTSKLTASYDDETLVNVDLEGVLTGATVSFMNGNTVIGTGVTDVNGIATYTYTPAASGTLSLKAVFAGTDNFDDCESSAVTVSVIAPVPDSITLSADKPVLSYYDSESATLSATVLDEDSQPCEGETVEFFKGSTSLGTATTNASGVATKSYSSTGVGDVSFTAECGNLLSETYTIEDCYYANTGNTNSLTIDSGVTCTIENGEIKITKSTSGEKFVKCSYDFYNTDHEITFKVPTIDPNTNVPLGFAVYRGSTQIYWAGYNKANSRFDTKNGSINTSLTAGDTIRIVKSGSTLTVYNGTTSLGSVSTATAGIKLAFYTNNNYVQYIDDIKVKAT